MKSFVAYELDYAMARFSDLCRIASEEPVTSQAPEMVAEAWAALEAVLWALGEEVPCEERETVQRAVRLVRARMGQFRDGVEDAAELEVRVRLEELSAAKRRRVP